MGYNAGPAPDYQPIKAGQVWRHRQTRKLYRVIAAGVDADSLDYTVCYQSLDDEQVFTRRKSIFKERNELVEDYDSRKPTASPEVLTVMPKNLAK